MPEQAQDKLLQAPEELARKFPSSVSNRLTSHEAAEMRDKLAAWEEDWNAPGMELYEAVSMNR